MIGPKDPPRADERIFDQDATLFENNGSPIYVLKDGRFAVWKAGKWQAKPSIASARKAVVDPNRSLQVMDFEGPHASFRDDFDLSTFEVVEWKESGFMRLSNGKRTHSGRYRRAYVHNVTVMEELKKLESAWKQFVKKQEDAVGDFENRFKTIVSGAIEVTAQSFENRLNGKP